MIFEIIASILLSIFSFVLVILFFKYYGAFKHHWVVWILMLTSAIIPFVLVIGILPFDITMSFYDPKTNKKTLNIILSFFYWFSFVLTWVINPIVVSYLRYPHSLTLKNRIWLTIRENLIFWGVILGVIIIGIFILIVSKNFSFSNLIPLAIALANGYGLCLLCLCLGFGFVSFPKKMWLLANPATAYIYSLQKISKETKLCASTIADGDAAIELCQIASTSIRTDLKPIFMDVGIERMKKLQSIKDSLPIPKRYQTGKSKNKKIKKFQKVKWKYLSESQLSEFFALLDSTIVNIEQTTSYVLKASNQALTALKIYNSDFSTTAIILKRISTILIALCNIIFLWGEICLMFKPKLSLFNFISHLKMPQIVHLTCVTAPVLSYLMFIGSWSLKNLRLGSFFRFIPGATNANTLNYFSIILCRLAPTIGYHYLQQIEAYHCEFQKVMGAMDVVVFIGNKWNIYSPILLILVMTFVFFDLFNKIANFCGIQRYTFDTSTIDYKFLENGEEVLCELQPEASEIIQSGIRFSQVIERSKHWIPRKFHYKTVEGLDDTPLNAIKYH